MENLLNVCHSLPKHISRDVDRGPEVDMAWWEDVPKMNEA